MHEGGKEVTFSSLPVYYMYTIEQRILLTLRKALFKGLFL